MNLLCPTDLTLAADVALSYSGHIAECSSGEVTLFHALSKKDAQGGGVDLKKAHTATLDQMASHGVKVSEVQREGAFMKEIIAESRNGYSMMVAGTHGVRGLRQEMLGSDMLNLVRMVAVPTLVVQVYSPRKVNMERILMPVAGHDDISPLLDAVCSVAKTCGSHVDVYQQLVEGQTTSNALLTNKVKMLDRLAKEGIKHAEVNEPVEKFYEGFVLRTIRHARNTGVDCIAIMAHASGEHKKIADKEKQELITNELGVPILCAV
ncbi:MAG: universal stress protein [Flavobacteriales bacterium]|jgi:nucleotide-binding universal stress UspA family protein|nr:universal stress protein [Flavobacteriales bacterium]MCB0759770.1 universal stress protein [Flavobacteriales bacterium]